MPHQLDQGHQGCLWGPNYTCWKTVNKRLDKKLELEAKEHKQASIIGNTANNESSVEEEHRCRVRTFQNQKCLQFYFITELYNANS